MIIYPLPRKIINISIDKLGFDNSYKACLIFFSKDGGIVKLINIILSILVWAIVFLALEILNDFNFSFFDKILVKWFFYLKVL